MPTTPPPYSNITGISRAVMKDNAQETLGNYNGNARPGELVVDLTQDPPPLYVGNNSGQLTLVASGGGGYGNTQVAQFLAAGLVGNIIPAGNGVNSLGNSTNYWANLWVANNTIYIGGVPVGMTAGNVLTVDGNTITGNVTFSGEAVIGTGASNTISGLYLAPDPVAFFTDGMYLRVRGNTISEATHIHFDTGNNQYFSQFIGDDNKYVELANTGNIVINTSDYAGNTAQWNFGTDGNLTLPYGAVIRDNAGNAVAFGAGAGQTTQGNAAVAIGAAAGGNTQGTQAIAIGDSAGNDTQGENAVAIGAGAGASNQGNNSIILNATGSALNQTTDDTFTVAPIRNDVANVAEILFYNTTSKEITYGDTINVAGNITGGNILTGGLISATGNITGNYFIGDGSQLTNLPGGGGNTGNVTFSDQVVIGTGTNDGGGGLYLAPGPDSVANSAVQYLRVRGGDYVTHIHLDTGNNAYYDQYFGADSKYVKLEANGNIVINADDGANSATWTFGSAGAYGELTLPAGEGIIKALDDTIALVSLNTTTGNANSVYLGSGGGLGFNDQEIGGNWLEIFRSGTEPEIRVPVGRGNLNIQTAEGGNVYNWTFDNTGNLAAPGNISTSANVTANYFIGDGSQLTGITASVPSQTILPTIQSITVQTEPAGLFAVGQGGANVIVANTIPVIEYGVIITDGTSNEKYKTGSLASIPGTVSLTFTTGLPSTQYTVYAYVTSNAGTFYSNSATGTSGICLLAGTQIALSDGSYKAIEHITYTDKMLSWDFDRGCYAETTALWIKRGETGSQYNLLTFSDGTTLRTFDQHRIFNKQAGAFTYPMTDATPVGTVTVNEHGQEITLIDKQVVVDTIEYYNVITDYHMNLFSDSILTSCRFNNIYPIQDMKFVKDSRPLRIRAEFENVPDRFFHGLRLAEQQFDHDMIEWYVARLESSEITVDSAATV